MIKSFFFTIEDYKKEETSFVMHTLPVDGYHTNANELNCIFVLAFVCVCVCFFSFLFGKEVRKLLGEIKVVNCRWALHIHTTIFHTHKSCVDKVAYFAQFPLNNFFIS